MKTEEVNQIIQEVANKHSILPEKIIEEDGAMKGWIPLGTRKKEFVNARKEISYKSKSVP